MTLPKNRKQEAFDELNELLGYYNLETKGETMAARLGFMMGWMSRLASQDWIIKQELDARLHEARKKNDPSSNRPL